MKHYFKSHILCFFLKILLEYYCDKLLITKYLIMQFKIVLIYVLYSFHGILLLL